MTRTARIALAGAAYIGAIVTANVLTARFGPIPVLPGIEATAGTIAAGLALGARDLLQDAAGPSRRTRLAVVLTAVTIGAAISWTMSTPDLAVASTVAVTLAELADFAVYSPLRARSRALAVGASNTVGALLDTMIFLTLAAPTLRGFDPSFTVTGAAPGQLIGKILWATAVPLTALAAVHHARTATR